MLTQPWRIQLFGGLLVQNDNLLLTRFKTQKIAGLLAYLAYHLPQVHSREVLIDLFWPESATEAGRASLSVALSTLRNQLEPPGTPAHAVLRADRFSLSLNPQAVTTDVADFEAAIKAAARAGSATERVQSLERAVDLYRGRLLAGMYEEWILPEETRLAGLFFDAVSALITHLEEAGRAPEALRYARLAVSVDPLREEAHEHLMRLLEAAGQPGAALRQYREMERLLEAELGGAPSAPLRALARRIEQASGLSAPAAAPARSGISDHAATRSSLTPGPGRPTTLTFLVTDIVSSTHLREQQGEPFRAALETHHAALRAVFGQHDGQELREAGDSFLVAFLSARQALTCAIAAQQALAEAAWPVGIGPLPVRMAVHTGDVTLEGGDYHGLALHRASGILGAAHGGQILVSEATAALARGDPGDLRLVDLGVWRLRDVSAPQRLFQLEYPGMGGAAFPAPSAASGYQPGLPLQPTRFFGREQEIARMLALLSPSPLSSYSEGAASGASTPNFLLPTPRLVTLTGPGGTGKSRLAVAVAERLLERFQGAVWFAALADLTDPDLIAGAILDALRLPRLPRQEPLEQAAAALSRHPALLILDNFEHLLTEPAPTRKPRKAGSTQAPRRPRGEHPASYGGAQIVQTLLARVPTLTLLVTSRQLLGLPGEQEFPVSPLPTPNGREPLEQMSLFDSVRLFVDRAQAVLPYFQVSNANAPAVAELCDRLEGLPLAIELAAARAQVLTPQQMLAQLASRFAFLTSRRRGVEERHRTLRAAVEWSYRLLTPELQRFFLRLSVFRGGWSVEAAEAVCEAGAPEGVGPGPGLALDYLAQLRECSLLLCEETAQGMRFRMLETLREYAQECLAEAGELEVYRRRHADCFLTLAEQVEPELQGREQAEWLQRLETEHDNLRAALAWYQSAEKGGEHGLRLAGALGRFWVMRGHLREGRAYLTAALSREGVQDRTKERSKTLNWAGGLADHQGDFAAARVYHEQSLEISREIGDRKGISTSLNNLGNGVKHQGDFAAAQTYHEQSLEISREIGDRQGIAGSLHGLGNVASSQGDYAAARSYLEQSLEIRREIGDRQGIASSLNNLGNLVRYQGDFAAARFLFDEALVINRELGNRSQEATNFENLGGMACKQGDYAAAQAYLEQSLEIKREIGDRRSIASSLYNLSDLAYSQGDYAAARSYLEQSLVINREIGNRRGIAYSLYGLGVVAYSQGDYAAARAYCEQSLVINREIGNRQGIAYSLYGLGNVVRNQGDYAAARAYHEQSLAIFQEIGERPGIAYSLEGFAQLAAAMALASRVSAGTPTSASQMANGLMKAARLWGAAEAQREEIGAPMSPNEREEYERGVNATWEVLGEKAFRATWEAGRAMTWEEAAAYALEECAA